MLYSIYRSRVAYLITPDDTKEIVVIEENKRLVHRFVEEFWNHGNMEAADELIEKGCVAWNQPFGPEGFKQLFTIVRTAFPDLQFTIEDMLAEGDQVAVRFVERGTHQGTWFGIPPTGKTIRVPGIAIFRIIKGKIVHQWSHNDFGGELQQLGARIVPGDE